MPELQELAENRLRQLDTINRQFLIQIITALTQRGLLFTDTALINRITTEEISLSSVRLLTLSFTYQGFEGDLFISDSAKRLTCSTLYKTGIGTLARSIWAGQVFSSYSFENFINNLNNIIKKHGAT